MPERSRHASRFTWEATATSILTALGRRGPPAAGPTVAPPHRAERHRDLIAASRRVRGGSRSARWPPSATSRCCSRTPGKVGADTKSYLYLDPGRLLERAWSMWDPNIGLGTVTHQNIGYLWPMGPCYWLFERLGVPDWVAQRLWLGSILFLAGLGVRYLLRTLGQRRHRTSPRRCSCTRCRRTCCHTGAPASR